MLDSKKRQNIGSLCLMELTEITKPGETAVHRVVEWEVKA